jgi:hypothetical protein
MGRADSSKVSAIFKAPTYLSLLNSITYQRTDKSHMKKMYVTESLKQKQKTRQANSGRRQDGLLQQCANIHCRYHYAKIFDQHQTVNKIC